MALYWYNEIVKTNSYFYIVWTVILLCAVSLGIYAYFGSGRAVVLVEWSTASELDTAGYNIYRSENPQGEYIKLNEQIIAASSDPWVGADYSFSDDKTVPGVRYYYLLEDVGLDGSTSQHGPVEIEATAGGRVEMVLAVFLVVVACGSMWFYARYHRRQSAENTSLPAINAGG